MRVASLDTADGRPGGWESLGDVKRTELAEQVLRRERGILQH